MTSCTVETINAAWTALAFLLPAIGLFVVAWKVGRNEKFEERIAASIGAIVCASSLIVGFHAYGQDSLRYVAAQDQGYKCVYDNNGSVHIIKPKLGELYEY